MSKKNLLETIKDNADKATEHLAGDEDDDRNSGCVHEVVSIRR